MAPALRRRAAATAALLAAAAALTGCGAGGGADPDDVRFAQQMVEHHEGAVAMAALADDDGRGASPAVRQLAGRIEAAQGAEVATMTGWLSEWDEPVEASGHGMDMGAGAEQQLAAATAADFDRLFLQQMTEHHRAAVEMARDEQRTGSDPRALALAADVERSQGAEVAEMQQLLAAGTS